jgi:hypothetical protein
VTKVIDIEEYQESKEPHAVFDGGCLNPEKHLIVVAPIEMIRQFVYNNQPIEDEENTVLRCIAADWLLDNDLTPFGGD